MPLPTGLTQKERGWVERHGDAGRAAAFESYVKDLLKNDLGYTESNERTELFQVLQHNKITSIAGMASMTAVPFTSWLGSTGPGSTLEAGYAAAMMGLAEQARAEVASTPAMGPLAASLAAGGASILSGSSVLSAESTARQKKLMRNSVIEYYEQAGLKHLPEYCRPQADWLQKRESAAQDTSIFSYADLESEMDLFFETPDKGERADSRLLQLDSRLRDFGKKGARPLGVADFLQKRMAYALFLYVRNDISMLQYVKYTTFLVACARKEGWPVTMVYDILRRQEIGRKADGWCDVYFSDFYQVDEETMRIARDRVRHDAEDRDRGRDRRDDKGRGRSRSRSPRRKRSPERRKRSQDKGKATESKQDRLSRKKLISACCEKGLCVGHNGLSIKGCTKTADKCDFKHSCYFCGSTSCKAVSCPKKDMSKFKA